MTKVTNSEASTDWTVVLEVKSHLKPTELAMMVNMFPGVIDARVVDSHRGIDDHANTSPSRELAPSPTGVDNLDTLLDTFSSEVRDIHTRYMKREIERIDQTVREYEKSKAKAKAELTSLINQTVSKELEDLLGQLPKKWILQQEDWHKYETQYQEHDKVIDNIFKLMQARVEFYRGKSKEGR